jgi:hypothetical protein
MNSNGQSYGLTPFPFRLEMEELIQSSVLRQSSLFALFFLQPSFELFAFFCGLVKPALESEWQIWDFRFQRGWLTD